MKSIEETAKYKLNPQIEAGNVQIIDTTDNQVVRNFGFVQALQEYGNICEKDWHDPEFINKIVNKYL